MADFKVGDQVRYKQQTPGYTPRREGDRTFTLKYYSDDITVLSRAETDPVQGEFSLWRGDFDCYIEHVPEPTFEIGKKYRHKDLDRTFEVIRKLKGPVPRFVSVWDQAAADLGEGCSVLYGTDLDKFEEVE